MRLDSLILQRFREGAPAPVEAGVARDVIRRLAVEPDESGAADLYAGDGGEATLDLSGLRATGGLAEVPVQLSVFSRGVVDLIYRFATATGMVVSAAGSDRIYLTDGGQSRDLPPERTEDAHTCVDGDELHWWLVRDAAPVSATPEPRKHAVTRGDALRSAFGLFRRD